MHTKKYSLKSQLMWRKLHHHEKTSQTISIWIYVNFIVCIQLYNFLKDLNVYKYKYITVIFNCDGITLFFRNKILNNCIRCIWINATYIIPIFVAPHCDVAVPLYQHCFILKVSFYGVSYLKNLLSASMNLSCGLLLYYFCGCYLTYFWPLSMAY